MLPSQLRFELVSFLHVVHRAHDHPPPESWFRNDDIHIIHVIEGKVRLRWGVRTRIVDNRSVFFMPPHNDFYMGLVKKEPAVMMNIHFRLNDRNGCSVHSRLEMPHVFRPAHLSGIHQRLRSLYPAWEQAKLLGDLTVQSEINGLVVGYFEACGRLRKDVPDDPDMEALRVQIRQDIRKPYSAPRLARRWGLSASQLNRRFRRAFRLSPKAYWQSERLKQIERMLLGDSTRALKSIAHHFGFCDVYYFSRWFKRKTGSAPAAFRREREERTL